jgi:hypothetical protein
MRPHHNHSQPVLPQPFQNPTHLPAMGRVQLEPQQERMLVLEEACFLNLNRPRR